MRISSFLIPGDKSQGRMNGNIEVDDEGIIVLTPL
jgi:hypothetical protein